VKEVGGPPEARKFWGRKEVEKKIRAGKEDGIFVHLQNGLNGLILNWCIGGCWFTPAVTIGARGFTRGKNYILPIMKISRSRILSKICKGATDATEL
jgi:hypothetical protein